MQTHSSARARAGEPPFDPDRPAWIDHGTWSGLDDGHRASLVRWDAHQTACYRPHDVGLSHVALVVPPGHYVIYQLDGTRRITAHPPTIWGYHDPTDPDDDPMIADADDRPLIVVEDNFEPDQPEDCVFGGALPDHLHPDWVPPSQRSREGIRAWTLAEARRLPAPRWLVEGLATEGELLLMYGKPKEGKTFIELDLALCVATGERFHGRAVGPPRRVAYVIAEGNLAQFMGRVDAWLEAHGLDDAPNLALVPQRVAVNIPPQVEELLSAIGRPKLVVMDTLARTLAGDENTPSDTGAYVAGCDEIRERTGAAVHVVHHQGKSAGKGPMGHTRLFGSIDTLLYVEQDARTRIVTLRVEAAKNGPDGDWMKFRIVGSGVLEPAVAVGEETDAEFEFTDDPSADSTTRVRRLVAVRAGGTKGGLTNAVRRLLGMSDRPAREAVAAAVPTGEADAVEFEGKRLWLEQLSRTQVRVRYEA